MEKGEKSSITGGNQTQRKVDKGLTSNRGLSMYLNSRPNYKGLPHQA